MINTRMSSDWSTTKTIAAFSCTQRVQEVHTKALLGLGVIFSCHALECIAKHIIIPRISADWSTTKPIAAFSCTPGVQEVLIKAEVVHHTPGLLGLGVIFNCHA